MALTQKINFLTMVSYSLLQTVFARTYRFATVQNVTDRRQTTDRRHSVPNARPIVVGQKIGLHLQKARVSLLDERGVFSGSDSMVEHKLKAPVNEGDTIFKWLVCNIV